MATDGIKIIDGDTAHDTYWGIMDLYDSGVEMEAIRETIPFIQENYYDDFDNEIHVTAYALAFWEIGHISDDILQEVKRVIEKGACVKAWTEDYGADTGRKREKELDKLWKKINGVNKKIRARKKYREITKLLYNINDVLAFQLNDGNYYCTIVLDIHQYRGACTYHFGKIIYKDPSMPDIPGIMKCEIIGRKIPSGFGMDMSKILSLDIEEMMKQGGIEKLLQNEAERTNSFVIGMNKTGIDHKDLALITGRFIKIGNLDLKEEYRMTGSMSAASSFEELTRDFGDLAGYIPMTGESTFLIRDMIR